jgi:type IV pilus assembly protein PilF
MIAKICNITLFFLLISSCTSFWNRDEKVSQLHLNLGISLLARGEYPGAIKELLIAEDLDGSNPAIYQNLGLAYAGRGRFDLAAKNIEKAISIDSKYTEAHNSLAAVYIEMGKFTEAEKTATVGLKDLTYERPDRLYLTLGVSLFWQKRYTDAVAQFSKSLEIKRTDCAGNTWAGRAYFELNQFQKASQFFDRALGSCDSQQIPDALFHGGWALFKLGSRELAKERWQRLITEHPDSRNSEKAAKILTEIE